MTFSDSRIAKLLETEYVPVWESVSPVRIVTFDLGEGRSFTGTANGEIAIYFCTPQGKVFDILPALQSPAVTLAAMKEALAFYKEHKWGGLNEEKIRSYHRERMRKAAAAKYQELVNSGNPPTMLIKKEVAQLKAEEVYPDSRRGEISRDHYIRMAVDDATRDMRVMIYSKVATPGVTEHRTRVLGDAMTVVEPGGKGYYQWQIGRAFHGLAPESYHKLYRDRLVEKVQKKAKAENPHGVPNIPVVYPPMRVKIPLETPEQWKEMLFEHIFKQELKGGRVKYNSDSLEAINLIEE
ncbi:hypothetical protein [Rubritalea squalenifaciens]|uniref:hypothetical protein n=1 Tax=Rubritalea squalenifaciens TaxID=407226 RepID=UPI0011602D62|nr:hypothetical protein [Rubritalea squalenifaciens]